MEKNLDWCSGKSPQLATCTIRTPEPIINVGPYPRLQLLIIAVIIHGCLHLNLTKVCF